MKIRKSNREHVFTPVNSVFTQLVLFTITVSIVPIIFISTMLSQKISGMIYQDLVDSQSQIAFQYISERDEKLFQYRDSIDQIANNTIVLNTLMGKSEDKNPYAKGNDVSIEVNKSLRLKSNAELRNCMIYSNVKGSEIYGQRVTVLDTAVSENWYSGFQKSNDGYFIYKSQNGGGNILSLVENIIYVDTGNFKSENVGFIKLDVLTDRLFAPAENPSEETYPFDVIVLDRGGNIVYSTNSNFDDILTKLSFEQIRGKKVNRYKGEIITGGSIEDYGLNFVFLFNDSQLSTKNKEIQRTILPAIVTLFCIIVVTAYVFTRRFSTRVGQLVSKIKVAETGDLTITGEIGGNDEIAVLDKQFNRMLQKLDNLINENYIQQLEKREAELKNLQLQINPHFLYNTLETISAIAAEKQAFTICELCEKLGGIFRYSLGKNLGEYVTLAQELQHTQNYLYIQQTRFRDKFAVLYNIAPDTEDMMIPRFILQPLVENAIVHGLANVSGKGMLEISTVREDEMLKIKVEDDGAGMPEEMVQKLTQYINNRNKNTEDDKKSIGIRNVNQRIKMMCGNEYGIEIESAKNRGSCFTICLPLNKRRGAFGESQHINSGR